MNAMSSEGLANALLDRGFCIVPDLVPRATIEALASDLDPVFAATPFGQGSFYGYQTKRFGSLLRRSVHSHTLVLEKTILVAVQSILGGSCHRIQLNVAQAIEIYPGERRQLSIDALPTV